MLLNFQTGQLRLNIYGTFVSLFYEIQNRMITENKYYTESQEKMARYAKAMAHPVRIFILDFLADNIDKCCYSGDMAEELPIARSTLSEHLKELKKAGLIQGEINPPYIKYCITKENWEEAKKLFHLFYER
jgi:ArsR family transcriptional regulator, arsenate/arsenite/antimonite-responsive transcriptional repressor